MTTALARDVRLEYDVRGTGAPVLMIQGLGYGRTGWGSLPERLARTHTVVTFDNRGFGDSDKPPGPYTMDDLARDALAVLDAAGLERAHVLGASLGGMTAQQLALAAPERVDKLVLVCTTPGGALSFPMPEGTVALFAQAQTLEPQDALRRFVVNALSPVAADDVVEEVFRYRVANPPDPAGWQAQLGAGPTHDVVDRLGELRMPTLLIHGTADNVVDFRNSELIGERIPNARLELLQGAGHLLFWEESERVGPLIEEFLA